MPYNPDMKNLSTIAPTDNNSPVNIPNNDIADLRYAMEQQFLKQLQLKNGSNQKEDNASKDKQLDDKTSNVITNTKISEESQSISIDDSQNTDVLKKTVNPNNADSDIICSNCSTKKTPLWRRDENGYILCNACGLFFKLHGKPRPISLKTDVIRSRNRKTKSEKLKIKNSEDKPVPKKRKSNKKSNSPGGPHTTNPLLVSSKSNGLISAAAYLGSNPSSAGSGLIKIVPKSENDYLLQNQQFNGSYKISANQGIVNKVSKPNGIAMYADSSNEQQPSQSNSSNFLKPMLSNNSNASDDKGSLGQRMVSINSMHNAGATPRLGPIWANSKQTVVLPSGFKSPAMLAIDKLASVSRQVASPLLSTPQDKKYTLPPLNSKDSQNLSTELVSPEPLNKLPNLKNVLINDNKEGKGVASISSILSTHKMIDEDAKDKQIRILTTDNKELELKLDICKNKIMELERKIYDLENLKT
ncbi:hypothetical protein FOG50_03543 [Hanseniaspora uvarum]|nr:hypothetical protein FOG50_03543 [Hanseniaspora uvarum]